MCEHRDRPERCLGMCSPCYFRYYRAQRKANGMTVRKPGQRPRGALTLDELLARILKVLPEATVGEDNDGQVVIYTNQKVAANGFLKSMGAYL